MVEMPLGAMLAVAVPMVAVPMAIVPTVAVPMVEVPMAEVLMVAVPMVAILTARNVHLTTQLDQDLFKKGLQLMCPDM